MPKGEEMQPARGAAPKPHRPSPGALKKPDRTGQFLVKTWMTQDRPPTINAVVCHFFCKGLRTNKDIATRANEAIEKLGLPCRKIGRKEVSSILHRCALQGMIRFCPPDARNVQARMKEAFPELLDVSVHYVLESADLSVPAAQMLVRLIRQRRKSEVHIGFAGGYTMCNVARALGMLLRQDTGALPETTLVFHSLGGAFDVEQPTTDPNAFFAYLTRDAGLDVKETRFWGLRAPATVRSEHLPELREWRGIKEAVNAVGALDIVVTSASCWHDKHNMLRKYLAEFKEPVAVLDQEGCVGDLLWRPLSEAGPIEADTVVRPMTLLELKDLPAMIGGNKKVQVLLVLGPCGGCRAPKTVVLSAILKMRPLLITHLVVDSRSAAGLFKDDPKA
jgi:DNA-binding transcriptional regulator LsrR (DeoR family)